GVRGVVVGPVGVLGGPVKWARRRPALATLLAVLLVSLGMAILTGILLWQQASARRVETGQRRERARQAIETTIDQAYQASRAERWEEGRHLLAGAADRLADADSDELRGRFERAQAELSLAERLDAIRLNRFVILEGDSDQRHNKAQADRDYDAAFRAAGLGDSQDPEDVGVRVGASNIRRALVAALDDWSVCATDQRRRRWLLEVARRADPDPTGWRDRARDPAAWNDRAALARLARTAPVEEQTLQLLV